MLGRGGSTQRVVPAGAVRSLRGFHSLVKEGNCNHVLAPLQRRGGEVPAGRAEREVERLLPRGRAAVREPRAQRLALEGHLHEGVELAGGDQRGAAKAAVTVAAAVATAAAAALHGPSPAAAGAAALHPSAGGKVERLLDADHELAVVGVGLGGRGSAAHRSELPPGLEEFKDAGEVKGDVGEGRILHHVVGVHHALRLLRALLLVPSPFGHVELNLGEKLGDSSRALIRLGQSG